MKNIVFCGGDKRELYVMRAMVDWGYGVHAFGWPEELLPEEVLKVHSPVEALKEADVCILPQTPIKKDGQLLSLCDLPVFLRREELAALGDDTPLLCGVASPYLKYAAGHCRIFEMAENDTLAIALAPASAEGAIAEAIRLSGNLLANSRALLIGFGRIGRELAWRLEGMGVDLVIMNRGKARAEEAADMGYVVADRSQLVSAALHTDYIFNTAPAPLLDELIIGLMDTDTCIIDLAAYPGGTDFAAAERRGIRAVHAGGLPGRYAPDYAGYKMAEFYPRFVASLLKKEG